MLDLGIKATVNSDDPAYFGGYITKNYTEIIEALSLSLEDVKHWSAIHLSIHS